MKTATVTDLRNKFANVSRWISDGEVVVITKHGKPFVTLAPPRRRKAVPPIDRMARLKRIFPDGPVQDSQAVIDCDRGET